MGMDGSLEADAKTPASYEYNVAVTKKVVDFAHSVGVSVEGELGCLGSLETGKGEAEDGHGFEGELSRTCCSPIPLKLLTSLPRPSATPWLSPSAPATVLINSPASPRVKCWPSAALLRSTKPSPILI